MGFSYYIIQWYGMNKRDLPWRHTIDPYRIWVSEIILQQTRVEQGLAYYNRFVERFPDIESLSNAEEEEVMKIWQGLGYYSRARNMHRSARTIHHENKAEFPASYAEIRRMHGVGDYSASAIASIAYGAPYPVVDGNVLRVIARYAGLKEAVNTSAGKKKVKEILAGLIDPMRPGDFNQAIMELGALVCKPKQPLCPECPIKQNCYAYLTNHTTELPVLNKPKPSKTRFFHYLVIMSRDRNQNYIWLKKRTGEDIWKNLYDFPLVESEAELSSEDIAASDRFGEIMGTNKYEITSDGDTVRHKLTHQDLRVKFILLLSENYFHSDYLKVREIDLQKYPVPKLIENFLKKVALRPGIFFKFPD
jgi:A/G-specific adenine glycosylase